MHSNRGITLNGAQWVGFMVYCYGASPNLGLSKLASRYTVMGASPKLGLSKLASRYTAKRASPKLGLSKLASWCTVMGASPKLRLGKLPPRYIVMGHHLNWGSVSCLQDILYRADSRLASCQWETSLQSNAVSHWLGANLESALLYTPMLETEFYPAAPFVVTGDNRGSDDNIRGRKWRWHRDDFQFPVPWNMCRVYALLCLNTGRLAHILLGHFTATHERNHTFMGGQQGHDIWTLCINLITLRVNQYWDAMLQLRE